MPAFGRREHVGEEQGGGREGGEEELVAGAEGAEVVEGGVGWLGGGEGEDGGEGCGAEGVGYALCGVSGAGEGEGEVRLGDRGRWCRRISRG